MTAVSKLNEALGASQKSTAEVSQTVATPSKRLLTKRELAAVLSVSERTLDNWLADKKIPRLRLSARLTRFSLPRVEAALARYEVREVGARR
jgi:excisionase family DNA binding protein